MSAKLFDYTLLAIAALVALMTWTGETSVGACAGLALAAFSGIFVSCGRWQAAPLALAGVLATVAFVLPPGIRFFVMAPIVDIVLLAGVFLLWVMPIPALPKPSGPYGVGLRRFVLSSVDAPMDSGFLIYAFYPALAERDARPRRYFDRIESFAASRAAATLGGPSFLFSHFRLAQTNVFENAAVADEASRFPLLVYNHGGISAPAQNTVLLSELASHGYIAVSIGHPGESSGIAWPDRTVTAVRREVIERLKQTFNNADFRRYLTLQNVEEKYHALRAAVPKMAETYPAEATIRWRDQSIAIVDRLLRQEVPAEAKALAARIDSGKIGYFGMSLGGSVAHACCMNDPRARAGVNLDGSCFLFSAIGEPVPTPFLNLAGDPRTMIRSLRKVDQQAPEPFLLSNRTVMPNDFYYESPATAGSRADVIRLIIPGATHGDFMDTILSARSSWRRFLGGGTIDSNRMINFLNAICVDFFDRYLRAEGGTERVLVSFEEVLRQDVSAVRAWAARSVESQARIVETHL